MTDLYRSFVSLFSKFDCIEMTLALGACPCMALPREVRNMIVKKGASSSHILMAISGRQECLNDGSAGPART